MHELVYQQCLRAKLHVCALIRGGSAVTMRRGVTAQAILISKKAVFCRIPAQCGGPFRDVFSLFFS
jgi:hypothetical protein